MFKGLKHTVSCDCGESVKYCNNFNEVEIIEGSNETTDCCKSKFHYIGLQAYNESILAAPVHMIIKEKDTENITKENVDNNQSIKVSIPTNSGIPGLIEVGPKGIVTNTQMIPVLKELIDKNELNKINILKTTYPETYDKSIKYLPKKYKDALIEAYN